MFRCESHAMVYRHPSWCVLFCVFLSSITSNPFERWDEENTNHVIARRKDSACTDLALFIIAAFPPWCFSLDLARAFYELCFLDGLILSRALAFKHRAPYSLILSFSSHLFAVS